MAKPIEPATREASEVAVLFALVMSLRRVGAVNMLYAHVNWESLFASADPPGAPSPDVARGSFTRDALRSHHQRRQALRSGHAGLARAILAL